MRIQKNIEIDGPNEQNLFKIKTLPPPSRSQEEYNSDWPSSCWIDLIMDIKFKNTLVKLSTLFTHMSDKVSDIEKKGYEAAVNSDISTRTQYYKENEIYNSIVRLEKPFRETPGSKFSFFEI
jgi:hypothetical protein